VAVDWSSVESDVLNAIAGVLGTAWQTNYPGAVAQIQAILAAGQQIERAHSDSQQSDAAG